MKTSRFLRHSLTHLFIIALGLLMIYPVVWMIISSFKPNNMIFSDPGIIPDTVTIETTSRAGEATRVQLLGDSS